jgi:hypothetical protein
MPRRTVQSHGRQDARTRWITALRLAVPARLVALPKDALPPQLTVLSELVFLAPEPLIVNALGGGVSPKLRSENAGHRARVLNPQPLWIPCGTFIILCPTLQEFPRENLATSKRYPFLAIDECRTKDRRRHGNSNPKCGQRVLRLRLHSTNRHLRRDE